MGVQDAVKKAQKRMGESVAGFGLDTTDTERVPTGLFEFDLAVGGGFPRGKASIVYGQESSNKTNLALCAIREHQRRWPDQTCIYIDVENRLSLEWAARLGVDTDELLVMKPDYAEQVVDFVDQVLPTEDCGLVVVDSLGMMVSTFEAEAEAEKAAPGGAGIACKKLVQKSTLRLNEASKNGLTPTLLYINQVRASMAQYGDPEKMPGGFAPKFQSVLTVRLYGKNLNVDQKVHPTMPPGKEVRFTIKKYTVPVVASSGRFEMATIPHDNLREGETDDFNTVIYYLEKLGHYEKEGSTKYRLFDEYFQRKADIKQRFLMDKAWAQKAKSRLIVDLMDTAASKEGGDDQS